MSKMKDSWEDTIKAEPERVSIIVVKREVGVTFIETLYDDSRYTDMELDAVRTRKFIQKLKKALAEAEGA